MKTFKTVDAYVASYPDDVQAIMKKMRKTIQKAAPDAEEGISYGMPVYTQNGVAVYFGGFKNHLGFFPGPSGVTKFTKELKNFKQSKGTIQFPYDEPIPYDVIARIVEFKVAQNLTK